MKSTEQIKQKVKEKYSEIAESSRSGGKAFCCGTKCDDPVTNLMNDDYEGSEGYVADADLGLGCGMPVSSIELKTGDTVLDLGSGAGNDCFIARHHVGDEGRVIGVDFSKSMVSKARENAAKMGYDNVEFYIGEIENLPVEDQSIDLVISNCVLNLVPDKERVFQEIFRVLKNGGKFSISDIVTQGITDEEMPKDVSLYVGCVAGAIDREDYISIIKKAGFQHVNIKVSKEITLPVDLDHLLPADAEVLSITVSGRREV